MMYMMVIIFSVCLTLQCRSHSLCPQLYRNSNYTLRNLLSFFGNGLLRGIYKWYMKFINCKKEILYYSDKLSSLLLPHWFAVHIKLYFCIVDKQQDILLKIIWIFVIIGSLILLLNASNFRLQGGCMKNVSDKVKN